MTKYTIGWSNVAHVVVKGRQGQQFVEQSRRSVLIYQSRVAGGVKEPIHKP